MFPADGTRDVQRKDRRPGVRDPPQRTYAVGMRRPDPRWIRSRDRLRSAALSLAARGPVDQVSMGEVAEEAGVSRSTAYLHAGSPRELLEDALRTDLDRIRQERLEEVPSGMIADARDAVAVDVIAHVEQHAEVYRFGLVESDALHPLLRDHFAASMRMLMEAHDLAPAVEEDSPLVRELVARSVAEMTAGQIAVWVAQPGPRDVAVFLAVNRAMMPVWWPSS
jgi:AcrR family transcriptional regulator